MWVLIWNNLKNTNYFKAWDNLSLNYQHLGDYTIQCVSKKMILSETRFYEPYRAFLKLTTQLDGISYETGSYGALPYLSIVWQSIKFCDKLQGGSIWLIKPCFAKYHFFWDTLYVPGLVRAKLKSVVCCWHVLILVVSPLASYWKAI